MIHPTPFLLLSYLLVAVAKRQCSRVFSAVLEETFDAQGDSHAQGEEGGHGAGPEQEDGGGQDAGPAPAKQGEKQIAAPDGGVHQGNHHPQQGHGAKVSALPTDPVEKAFDFGFQPCHAITPVPFPA